MKPLSVLSVYVRITAGADFIWLPGLAGTTDTARLYIPYMTLHVVPPVARLTLDAN